MIRSDTREMEDFSFWEKMDPVNSSMGSIYPSTDDIPRLSIVIPCIFWAHKA